MKITIFGSGYVGLVTAACFADVGNNVCCVDVDKDKIEKLNFGVVPIFEPGLEKLIKTNKNGIPDLIAIPRDSKVIFSEIKRRRGKVTALQKYRLKELNDHGIETEIYRGEEI